MLTGRGGKRSVTTAQTKMTRCLRRGATTPGKSFSLGFFWSTVALLASGVVLWFPERIPWNLRFLRYISVLVHPAAALFTIGLFLIHIRSEEHTSELQSQSNLVCRLLLEKKKH